VRLDAERFLVKASGSNLATLRPEETVERRFAPLLELLKQPEANDADVDEALMLCRVDFKAKRPSVEALFHAYLLSLPGVAFVGTRILFPLTPISLLSSARRILQTIEYFRMKSSRCGPALACS
jgi:hypothetical protein